MMQALTIVSMILALSMLSCTNIANKEHRDTFVLNINAATSYYIDYTQNAVELVYANNCDAAVVLHHVNVEPPDV